MSPRQSKSAKSRRKLVRRIPPTEPAARDEGPRLISLDEHSDDTGFGKSANYYTTLADKLLQTEGKAKRPKTHNKKTYDKV